MILLPVALVFVDLDIVQFAGWVVQSWVCIDVVFNGIITKLQCLIFHMKTAVNRVPSYVITFILSLKLYVCSVIDLLVGLF